MSVTIQPIPGSVRLRVTGDIETILTVPYEDDDRFMVGLSDGTLLLGLYDERLECEWSVLRDGAGIARFHDRSVRLDALMEWVTLSVYDPNVAEEAVPCALPLFPDLDRWAA